LLPPFALLPPVASPAPDSSLSSLLPHPANPVTAISAQTAAVTAFEFLAMEDTPEVRVGDARPVAEPLGRPDGLDSTTR
jgi:hypothetical protein